MLIDRRNQLFVGARVRQVTQPAGLGDNPLAEHHVKTGKVALFQTGKDQHIATGLLHDDDALFPHQRDAVSMPVPGIPVCGGLEGATCFGQVVAVDFAGMEMDHRDDVILPI